MARKKLKNQQAIAKRKRERKKAERKELQKQLDKN